MPVTPESLCKKYRYMSTDNLQCLLLDGGLTDEATAILKNELQIRGALNESQNKDNSNGENELVLSMRWYKFYTYIRLPFGIFCNSLIAMSWLNRPSYGTGYTFSFPFINNIIIGAAICLQISVFIGMLKKQRSILPWNELLIVCEAILLSWFSWRHNGFGAFIGSALVGTVWFWLNRIYFRKRSFLFIDTSPENPEITANPSPATMGPSSNTTGSSDAAASWAVEQDSARPVLEELGKTAPDLPATLSSAAVNLPPEELDQQGNIFCVPPPPSSGKGKTEMFKILLKSIFVITALGTLFLVSFPTWGISEYRNGAKIEYDLGRHFVFIGPDISGDSNIMLIYEISYTSLLSQLVFIWIPFILLFIYYLLFIRRSAKSEDIKIIKE